MSEGTVRLEIGTILSRTMALLGSRFGLFGGMVGAIALLGGLADTYAGSGGSLGVNIAMFFMSVYATFQALAIRTGGLADMAPRFGRAFGLSLLSGIAIGLGLILLIVPGLMLFTRWAVALPAMLREDLGISAALERSSDLTDGNRWRILGLALLIWVPFLLLMVLVGAMTGVFAGEAALDGLGFNIAVNLMAGGLTLFSALCWTEAYLALGGAEDSAALADVFA